MRLICERCNTICNVMPHTVDFVHDCSNAPSETLRTEDVFEIGQWTDYTGSGGERLNNYRGVENTLQGTRAEIEGGETADRTSKGRRATIYRERTFLEYIDVKEKERKQRRAKAFESQFD